MYIYDQNRDGGTDTLGVGGATDVDNDLDLSVLDDDSTDIVEETPKQLKEPKVPDNIADKKPSVREALKHSIKREAERLSDEQGKKDNLSSKKTAEDEPKDEVQERKVQKFDAQTKTLS